MLNSVRSLWDYVTVAKDVYGSMDSLYGNIREINGLETHYPEFDRMTCGLQKAELIVIAGNRAMGKTSLALNIAENVGVRAGKAVALFTMEMTRAVVLRRMLASQALVNSTAIQTGMLMNVDRSKLVEAMERLMESKIYIDDTPAMTLGHIRTSAFALKEQRGELDLVIVDYLQLMTGSAAAQGRSAEYRVQEMSEIVRGLKALAKELDAPVVAVSQLSRFAERRGGDMRPLLRDLRDSGSIENDADVVCFIHREEVYDPENEDLKGKAELIIAKQRNGPTGSLYLAFLADFQRFENLTSPPEGGERG